MHPISSHSLDAVFERTHEGQRALLSEQSQLNATERRLLGMLNGFTSLAHLRELLRTEDVSSDLVQEMASRGLIRPPKHADHHFFFGWPCALA